MRKVLHIGDEMIDLKNKVFLDSDGEMTFENKERLNFIMHFMKQGAVEQVATNKDGTFVREDAEISFNEIWLPCAELKAKQQATPEGFVLMPIKPTETMVMAVAKEHEGEAFLPYSLYDAYVKQAMIESQEQSHDNSN